MRIWVRPSSVQWCFVSMSDRNVYDEKGWAMPEAVRCWWTSIAWLCFFLFVGFLCVLPSNFLRFSSWTFLVTFALTLLIFLFLPSLRFTCLPPARRNVTCGELKRYVAVWYYGFGIPSQGHGRVQGPAVFKTTWEQVSSKYKNPPKTPNLPFLPANKAPTEVKKGNRNNESKPQV